MSESIENGCVGCPKLEQVDSVVRQMGVISTDEGVEALAGGSAGRASELIGVGRSFISMADQLDKILVSTCDGPKNGTCNADSSVARTVDQICEDIIFARPELDTRSVASGEIIHSSEEQVADGEVYEGCICGDGAYCAGYEQWLASGCDGALVHG